MKIELIGIFACFCGVLLMAEADPNTKIVDSDQSYRLIGFILMCVVAANDGMVAVLARRMKDVHFSIMMYWFAALGLLFTSTTMFVKCMIT